VTAGGKGLPVIHIRKSTLKGHVVDMSETKKANVHVKKELCI
jgi:hypothetical protein